MRNYCEEKFSNRDERELAIERDNQRVKTFIASQTALGRAGLPDDIGSVIASLLSPANGWVTAQRIEASGGMYL